MCLYKRADIPILEKPKPYDPEQGWMKTDEGVLKPLWSSDPVLPESLVDLLGTDWVTYGVKLGCKIALGTSSPHLNIGFC